jgi:hypothetical protein
MCLTGWHGWHGCGWRTGRTHAHMRSHLPHHAKRRRPVRGRDCPCPALDVAPTLRASRKRGATRPGGSLPRCWCACTRAPGHTSVWLLGIVKRKDYTCSEIPKLSSPSSSSGPSGFPAVLSSRRTPRFSRDGCLNLKFRIVPCHQLRGRGNHALREDTPL